MSFVSSFDVYACGNLDLENEVYDVMGDVSSDGTCFNVLANNVTLDCNGRSIIFGNVESGFGVNVNSYNNFTIKDCEIVFGLDSVSDSFGLNVYNSSNLIVENLDVYSYSTKSRWDPYNYLIFLSNVYDSRILNSNFTSLTSSGRGGGSSAFRIEASNNITIYNNTFLHENEDSSALYLEFLTNSKIEENEILTRNLEVNGVHLEEGCNGNEFYNNTIFVEDGISYDYPNDNLYSHCFSVSSSRNNVFKNNSLTSFGGQAISFSGYNEGSNDFDSSNLIEGRPLYYNSSISNYEFLDFDFSLYGQVICFDCGNVNYSNSNFTNDGLSLFFSSSINILDSNLTSNNSNSFYSYYSNDIYLNNSYFETINQDIGTIFLETCQGGVIENSEVVGFATWNSYFEDVQNFSLSNNFFDLNDGIVNSKAGSDLVESFFNVSNNYFVGSYYCFESSRGASYNFENNIFNTSYGDAFFFDRGSLNIGFYEDDFLGNGIHFTSNSDHNLSLYGVKNFGNVEFSGSSAVVNFYNLLEIEVVDTLGVGVSSVLSIMRNIFNDIILSDSTDSFGLISRFGVLEYIESDSGIVYNSPYEINFSKDGFYDENYNFDLNFSKKIVFEIYENVFPRVFFADGSLENNSGVNEEFYTNFSIEEKYLSNVTWNWNNELNLTLDIGGLKPVGDLFDGLVGFWNADNLGEDSVGTNNLSFYGDANVSDGVYGDGFSFDGDGDSLEGSVSNNVSSVKGAFSFWVKFNEKDHRHGLFHLYDDLNGASSHYLRSFVDADSNQMDFFIEDEDEILLGLLYDLDDLGNFSDQWLHVVWVQDGEGVSLYINGDKKLDHGGNGNWTFHLENLYLTIGENLWADLNGSIDEFMIFNRSLSDREVDQLYKTFSRKYSEDNYSVYYNDTLVSGDSEVNIFSDDADFINYMVSVNQGGLNPGEEFVYNLGVYDLSGNYNETEFRYVKGNSDPVISNIILSSNNSNYNDIDPGTFVSFDCEISDVENNLDYAEFQIWNGSSLSWDSFVMNNLSEYNYSTNFTYGFNTSLDEMNYTFRIRAVDLEGGIGYSDNQSLESLWDCSWETELDFDVGIGFKQNKKIGNLIISNIGDVEYDGGCSLNFLIDTNMGDNIVYYDDIGYGNAISYEILEEESLSLPINASFDSDLKEEDVSLIIEETLRLSDKRYSIENFTLITNEEGPYLFLEYDIFPEFVYLKNQDFSIKGSLRNLMGDVNYNENSTAYNVSFQYDIPNGLELVSGNETLFYENISDNFKHHNEISLSFSDLESFSPGIKEVKMVVEGVDLNSNEILDANNEKVVMSKNINFLCNPEPDDFFVKACGILDGDYVEPEVVNVVSSGGGGGGSPSDNSFETSEELQLVRGRQNEIEVVFENPSANEDLYDLSFSVEGDIAKYIEILPEKISKISSGQDVVIKLLIVSPSYIETGRQRISVKMTARSGSRVYSEKRNLDLEIHDLSSDEAKFLVQNSRYLMSDLLISGLYSESLFSLLDSSVKSINTFEYEKIEENYKIIESQVDSAIKSKNGLEELRRFAYVSDQKGIDIKKTLRMMKLAELSLSRGDFEKAYSLVQDAQVTYALETKGKIGRIIYYLKKYPYQVLASIFILTLIILISYKLILLRRYNLKLKSLRRQRRVYLGLIKTIQEDCFEDNKMSMSEYDIALEEYRKKISGVVRDIISVEIKKRFLFKVVSRVEKLKVERERILSEVKNIQIKYLKDKEIESPEYEANMESYTSRLSEIEEKIATAEAKEEYKKVRKKRK